MARTTRTETVHARVLTSTGASEVRALRVRGTSVEEVRQVTLSSWLGLDLAALTASFGEHAAGLADATFDFEVRDDFEDEQVPVLVIRGWRPADDAELTALAQARAGAVLGDSQGARQTSTALGALREPPR